MTDVLMQDQVIIRPLALRYRALSLTEENQLHKRRAYAANDLKGGRPFVSIHELPMHEMNYQGILDLHCTDPLAREMERFFRVALYRWDYFRVDTILEDAYYLRRAYTVTGGLPKIQEETRAIDGKNHIISHAYIDVLPDEASLEKITKITVTPHPELDKSRVEKAEALLNGIMPVRLTGLHYDYFAPWDQLARVHGVENLLFDLIDRPEFMHDMMQRYCDVHFDFLDQMEQHGLLGSSHHFDLHCTASHISSLPAEKEHFTTRDIWLRGTAQIFGSCSPMTYKEFELDHMLPLISRFGCVYYGCCEPLEHVIPYLKALPNIRKIGVSPFANLPMCAEQIKGDYVLSRKAHPALVAGTHFSAEQVKAEIMDTILVCETHGCSFDYTLKDISTVCYHPERIFEWSRIVTETLDEVYGKDA